MSLHFQQVSVEVKLFHHDIKVGIETKEHSKHLHLNQTLS